jgi:hypothetical protein
MDTIALKKQLIQAKNSPDDFIFQAKSITDSLNDEEAGLESVTAILKFMEENPAFDFGAPGPLAHFMEKFYRRGYEAELVGSLSRRPTVPTISLLNRLINGTKQAEERERYFDALRQVETHPLADDEMKRLAAKYLQRVCS